jgi:hypothetical protein
VNRFACRVALVGLIGLAAHTTAAMAAETVRYLAPGKSPVTLDEKALAAMPRTTVQAGAHGDAPSAWEGVDRLSREGVRRPAFADESAPTGTRASPMNRLLPSGLRRLL